MNKLATISDFCNQHGLDYKGRNLAENRPAMTSWEWTGDKTAVWAWVEDDKCIQICISAHLKSSGMEFAIQIDVADDLTDEALSQQLQELADVFDLRGAARERGQDSMTPPEDDSLTINSVEEGQGWNHGFRWYAYDSNGDLVESSETLYLDAESAIKAGEAWAARDPDEK